MFPQQVLAAVLERYAEFSSYRDCGQVTTRFTHLNGSHGHTTMRLFKTAFVRPDRFRFEFLNRHGGEKWARYVVWAEGKKVMTWWDVESRLEHLESLNMAVAGATGVSGGAAYTIPAPLMPAEIGGAMLTDLDRLTRLISLGDEPLREVACYRLQGWFPPRPPQPDEEEQAVEGPLTLWIDRGTFLIRRMEQQTQFDTFRTEEVTTYEPAVGIQISEDELRFNPPLSAL